MKTYVKLFFFALGIALLLAACAPAAQPTAAPPTTAPTTAPQPTAVPPTTAPQPTAAPATTAPQPTTAPAAGALTCDQPIKVGLVTDLTGALAIYGVMADRSVKIGFEYAAQAPGQDGKYKIDNCEIQVIVKDDKSDPKITTTAADELINVEKVNVLIGTVNSGATATLQGIARDNKVPLIVAPAAANDITGKDFNEYTFRVSRNNYQDYINLCKYLTTKYKTFVQIAPDYAFGRGGAASARDACTLYGGTFVKDDIFAPLDTKEFTPYMEQILNSGADAWIVTWAGAGFVPLIQSAKDLGVTEKMGLGASLADNKTVPVFYASMVGQNSGILYHYTLPKNAINDFLIEKVQAQAKTPPDLFDADGMNAALAVVAALRKTGGKADAASLVKALEGLEFDGPKGAIKIRAEDHVALQDMYIVKIVNVNDPQFKFFELVDTTRPEPPCLLPEALKSRCGSLPYGSLKGQ